MAALKGVKTIDMTGGEITKVVYEGAEYERVEGDAKVGDIIRLPGNSYKHAIPGGFYAVISVIDRGVIVMENCGNHHRWTEGLYELFRKKHVRLKVGDYAKVAEDDGRWNVSKGDLVKVSDDDKSTRPFHCDILRGAFGGHLTWLRESDLVLATEDEVAAAKEAEEKRSIEAKWAEIGRKVDEYKVGDIVAYDDPVLFMNEGIGEVIVDSECSRGPKIGAIDDGGALEEYYLPRSRLSLITPVEARFDRS
ncbi:hypothetical protein [Bacillus sp. 005/A4HT-01/001]|uniref:hypothetical protein n=1 Tax=Bacillus sp. 005/A4HT-01/001 TaxID=2509010 RepID=UPI00107551E2|nr:hypothetical protein [Bacillus sp. 005/A4HT-01/001]TFW49252.1 hypothetical protein ES896_02205 [Bacillus sp. 005/A4HT-01/001]